MNPKDKVFRICVVGILAMILVGVTTGIVSAEDPMFFNLDSEPLGTGFEMERSGGPGDDGQTGSVIVSSGGGFTYWMADEAAQVDYLWPAGCWTLQMCTDSDWGTNADLSEMKLGSWNPTTLAFTEFITHSVVSVSYDTPTKTMSLIVECTSSDEVTPTDEHFALKLTNNDSIDHTVYTGGCSWLEAPCNGPTYPVPELTSVILVLLGIAVLGGVIYTKQRQSFAKTAA